MTIDELRAKAAIDGEHEHANSRLGQLHRRRDDELTGPIARNLIGWAKYAYYAQAEFTDDDPKPDNDQ